MKTLFRSALAVTSMAFAVQASAQLGGGGRAACANTRASAGAASGRWCRRSGDPCEAERFHGFIGMETEAVDLIAGWIRQPTR